MRIAVCVKQVLDSGVPLRVVDGVVRQEAPWPIAHLGAADRAALEEGLKLAGKLAGVVTAISAGQEAAAAALRFCLARGAGRAVQVARGDDLDPVATALAVSDLLAGGSFGLVLCGGESGDGGSGRFPAELAARLDWPLVTAVAAVTLDSDGLKLERRIERGDREVVRCGLPAVLAVDPILAEARYVSVRARRVAANEPIDLFRGEVSGVDVIGDELIALEPAKPRPKRTSGPAAGLSAMDRLAHAITGGVQQKQSGGFVEGPPATVAAEILRFLEERGFTGERRG